MERNVKQIEIHFSNGEYFRVNFEELGQFNLYNVFENVIKKGKEKAILYFCCAGFEVGVDANWRETLFDGSKSSGANVNVAERLKDGDVVKMKLLFDDATEQSIMTPYVPDEHLQRTFCKGNSLILSCNTN